jgi:hypothetical protein
MRLWTCKAAVVSLAAFCLGWTINSTARAADEVASPQYQAWAKFKPGSSSTLTSDMKVGPNGSMTIHVEMTTTLLSVTPEQAEVEAVSKTDMMGRGGNPTHVKRTIKAKEPARDMKETGTEDVKAMDKTFKCKVFKLSGEAAANQGSGRGGRGPANATVTLYVNPDVPGGIVKMETIAEGAPPFIFILSAMNVK